jgi:soluble lytic murein transglycosylase
MRKQWGRSIQVRYASLAFVFALGALIGATPVRAQTRQAAAQQAASQLSAAMEEIRKGSHAAAISRLQALPDRIPELADYVWFHYGSSQLELKNYAAAIAAFAQVYEFQPPSPFAARAILAAAEAELQSGRPQNALALLRQYLQKLPQPQVSKSFARAYEAAEDPVSAAAQYQRIYYNYPNTAEAKDAGEALARLRSQLGERFPPTLAQAVFTRAKGLADGRRYAEAIRELEQSISTLGGPDQELARVRIGVVEFQSRQYQSAYKHLRQLQLASPDADAERLHYLVWCARRLDLDNDMTGYLGELDRKYPTSHWRLEAQLAAAELFLNRNEQESYEPIFRTCAETFRDKPQASYCDWKVTWANYLKNQGNGESLFKNHLKQYPSSEKVPASLYFLGRHAESGDPGAAKVYYTEIDLRYPNHYYAMLARERLQDPVLQRAAASATASEWLRAIPFTENRRTASFVPLPVTKQRIERARLLESANLNDLAEQELRFAARTDGQPQVITIELARILGKRNATDEALRAVKAYVPGYLSFPWESAPESFWRVAFPLPFREPLERHARQQSLDPFVVAGLIRQESEFNPKAVSVANAHGLTQVMPSTGKWLSRPNGISRFHSSMLFQPEINLKLGTYYLSQLLNSLQGKWEQALASYNGGKSRVLRWIEWGNYREPAEFVETIPLRETRDYVQIVMRNAEVYRKLYANTVAAVSSSMTPSTVHAASSTPASTVPPKNTAVRSTAAKSTAAKSTATKNTATKSTAAKNTAAKSTATKSSATRTITTKSTAVKSTAAKNTVTTNNAAGKKASAQTAPQQALAGGKP